MEKTVWCSDVVTEDMDMCPHVKVGEKATIHRVYDCCGLSLEFACCPECAKQAMDNEEELPFECTECGSVHPKRDMRFFRYYDDSRDEEPEVWCPVCQESDKIKGIIAADKKALEEEMSDWDLEEDDDFDPEEIWEEEREEEERDDGRDDEDDLDDILRDRD